MLLQACTAAAASKTNNGPQEGSCASPGPLSMHTRGRNNGPLKASMPGHAPRLEAPLHPGLPIHYKCREKKGAIYKNVEEFLTVPPCA